VRWASAKLEDVAYVFNGKTPSKAEQKTQGHPVLKIKNVDDKRRFKGTFESFVDINVAAKSESKLIELNDTLILNAAHNADYVGSKQYRAELEVVNSLPTGEWLIVRKKGDVLDSIYLNHWLRLDATRFQIKHLVKGIHLYPKDVARLTIPLPPLEEQEKIAAILDAADRLRQKDAQLIAKYNALSQSLFLAMFGDPVTNPMGWERKKLQDIVTSVIDCPHSTPKWTAHGKVGIRTSNLTKGGWCWDDKRYVSESEFHNRSKRAYVKPGDIVLSREGTIGIAAIVINGMEICLGQRLVQLIPELNTANNYYLLYLLLLELEPERINRVMVGATSKHLNVKELRNMSLPVPLITLQNQFAERIQAIEAQKQQAQASLQKSEDLFNSLLQRAFKGELTT